jgi:hypothetical protein
MGCRRAGWYSYDGLDNAGIPSTDRIIPEFQQAQPGDIFPQTPKAGDRFVVQTVEPERTLVLGDDAGSMSWAFVLEPAGDSSTRLITRSRGAYDRLALGLMFLFPAARHPRLSRSRRSRRSRRSQTAAIPGGVVNPAVELAWRRSGARHRSQRGEPAWRSISRLMSLSEIGLCPYTNQPCAAIISTHAPSG